LNPKPVILVGKNGSGKTYTLSYIADAFYELAKKKFSDVVARSSSIESPYFRVISGRDINTQSGSSGAATYIKFLNIQDQKEIHYCEKIGDMSSCQELLNLYGGKINNVNEGKKIEASTEDIKQLFSNTITFFPSFRKIIPHWLNLDAQI